MRSPIYYIASPLALGIMRYYSNPSFPHILYCLHPSPWCDADGQEARHRKEAARGGGARMC